MHSWAVIQRQELEAAEDGGGLRCVRFCLQKMKFRLWQQHRFLIARQLKAEKLFTELQFIVQESREHHNSQELAMQLSELCCTGHVFNVF